MAWNIIRNSKPAPLDDTLTGKCPNFGKSQP